MYRAPVERTFVPLSGILAKVIILFCLALDTVIRTVMWPSHVPVSKLFEWDKSRSAQVDNAAFYSHHHGCETPLMHLHTSQ